MLQQIQLGYPNVWIQDSDSERVKDILITLSKRRFFCIDYDKGFSEYIDGEWKTFLVEDYTIEDEEQRENAPKIKAYNYSIAIDTLKKLKDDDPRPITYIYELMGSVEMNITHMAGMLSSFKNKYRKAFWQDDLSQMPIQIVFISNEPVPAKYASLFNISNIPEPTIEELCTIVTHINDSANQSLIDQNNIFEAARSGLGLSETEYISLCLQSVVDTKKIDPKTIYDCKMRNVKQNGILEIITPKISFDNIGGLDNIKDIIKRTAVLRSNAAEAKKYGITPIRRILMVGVPGTGKSAICQATSSELGLDLARTGISQVMNKYIGQSEENMRAVFQQIKAMSPLCVWIDEFGRDLSGSGQGADSGTTDRVHGEFLTGLQELPEESLLLCAANELNALKPEMLRADRFDKIFFVGLPSHDERKHIFQINLGDIETDHEYDYDALAEATAFMTGAEIVSLIRETKFYVTSDNFRPIVTQDILERAPQIRNTIWRKHPDMVKNMYQYALEQWDWASTSQMEDAKIVLGRTQKSKSKVVLG